MRLPVGRELDQSCRTARRPRRSHRAPRMPRPRRPRGPTSSRSSDVRAPEVGSRGGRSARACAARSPRYACMRNSRPRCPPAAPRTSRRARLFELGQCLIPTTRPEHREADAVWPTDINHGNPIARRVPARYRPRCSRTAASGSTPTSRNVRLCSAKTYADQLPSRAASARPSLSGLGGVLEAAEPAE